MVCSINGNKRKKMWQGNQSLKEKWKMGKDESGAIRAALVTRRTHHTQHLYHTGTQWQQAAR